jgi:tryptophan synthase alpha chain
LDVGRLLRNVMSQTHNRIDECFTQLRSTKRKGFIPYICAGDPNLKKTVELALALESAGADLVELGIPFSDPLADGVVNQLAAQRALAVGMTVGGVLECVRQIRDKSAIPIVLYTYLNPILQFGFEKVHREAEEVGVDGLLILDLPPEEETAAPPKLDRLKRSSSHGSDVEIANGNVFHIRLIAPTTSLERAREIVVKAKGFLYYVSREGVTGVRDAIVASLGDRLAELRKLSNLPIAVGFGISNIEQARQVAQDADAVVVGSAIVDLIAKHGDKPDLIDKVGLFARQLADAVHSTAQVGFAG